MKNFIFGFILGILLLGIYIFIDVGITQADEDEQQLDEAIEMELAYYRYHHETLSDALAGKCER